MTYIEPRSLFELVQEWAVWSKQLPPRDVHGMLTDWKTAYYRPTTAGGHWGETITDCATNCTLQHASKRDIVLIYVCMGRASCLFL